jgi:hypothetical protein
MWYVCMWNVCFSWGRWNRREWNITSDIGPSQCLSPKWEYEIVWWGFDLLVGNDWMSEQEQMKDVTERSHKSLNKNVSIWLLSWKLAVFKLPLLLYLGGHRQRRQEGWKCVFWYSGVEFSTIFKYIPRSTPYVCTVQSQYIYEIFLHSDWIRIQLTQLNTAFSSWIQRIISIHEPRASD